MKSVVIYDSDCVYCSNLVGAVRKIDKKKKLNFLPFKSKIAQKILHEQFGKEIGFTLYLFEKNRATWGDSATLRLIKILGFPPLLAKTLSRFYPHFVKMISFMIRRHQLVCPPGQEKCRFIKVGNLEYAKTNKKVQSLLNNLWRY